MKQHDLLSEEKKKYEIKHDEEVKEQEPVFNTGVVYQEDQAEENKIEEPVEIPEEMQYQFEKKKSKKGKGKKVPNYVLKNKRKKLRKQAVDDMLSAVDQKLNATFEAWDKKEADKEFYYPTTEALELEHEEITETVVKHHTFKKDEVITQTVVVDKEQKVTEKRAAAKRLALCIDDLDKQKVMARANVDINDKKLMDYRTFEEFSEFAPLLGREGSLSKLCSSYGKAKKNYKKNMDSHNEENANKIYRQEVCPTLDVLTDTIMKIDATSFKLESDAELAKNASELEAMARALSAYTEILQKEPKYRDYLFSKKYKDTNETWGDKVLKQMDRLSAVSEYYRLRRLVIEDEYYQEHANEEIPLEEQKGDTIALKRLKKNMRASVMAAGNLTRIFKTLDIPNPVYKDYDMAGILTKTHYQNEEKDETERKKVAERHFQDIASSNQYIRNMENERYLQPPLWMQNVLTLDPEEIKKKGNNKDAGWVGGTSFTDTIMVDNYLKKKGKTNLFNKIDEMRKKKTGGEWGNSPNFIGGDKLLKDITISDNWDRMMRTYASEQSYRRTDEEMLEMMDILSIQKDTKKWKKIKEDPEAAAFYESAYKEMVMKNISILLSSTLRVDQTIGVKFLSLHTIDLVQQLTPELRSAIMNTSIITNITGGNNMELIDELFKNNNKDGKYFYDPESLRDVNAMGTKNFRLGIIGATFYNIVMELSGDEEEEEEDFFKKANQALFGSRTYYDDVILPEYDANREQAEKEGFERDSRKVISWYLIHHPEFMTEEKLNLKVDGKYIFQMEASKSYRNYLSNNEGDYRRIILKKKVDVPSAEELEKYEKSLKNRKLFAMRTDKPDDPKPDEEIKIKGTNIKVKQRQISENRKKDPYGVNLVKNAMDEMVVKDANGNVIKNENGSVKMKGSFEHL